MLGFLPNLPNAKQLYHLNLEGGHCRLFPTSPELDEFIDYYWMLSITSPTLQLTVIPDTAVDLVLSPDIADFAALYFPTTDIQRIPLRGPITYAGICFRPNAITSLLGAGVAELRTLEMGADTVEELGIGELVASTLGVTQVHNLKEGFDRFWADRLEMSPTSSSALTLSELVNVMEHSLGNASVASVCRSMKISERHFRRLSNELFGLSPKKMQRILRLQRALIELFQCERKQVQDLYYDDSHRIRELKKLTGFTPQQIRKMAEKYNQSL